MIVLSPTVISVVMLRRLRPLVIHISFFIYICFRLSQPITTTTTTSSLLECLVTFWTQMKEYMIHDVVENIFHLLFFYNNNDNNNNNDNYDIIIAYVQELLLTLIQIISIIAQDVIAIAGVFGLLRFCYCLYNFHIISEFLHQEFFSMKAFFQCSNYYLPFVNTTKIQQEISNKILKEANTMLQKDPNRIIRISLPKKGITDDIILKELTTCAIQENNKCSDGKISGTCYSGGQQHSTLMNQVYSLYAWSNPMKPGVWPKINQCEAEMIAMTSKILHSPSSIGCVTSGGTESIILTVRAHLICYGKRRSILYPEIICNSTAHCSLNKACDILGIRLVTIDCCRDDSYDLKADQVRMYITCNTIMIFASAPTFPHGIIDPIDDLSTLAMQYDIGLHVDACLGGFVLPFCDYETVPQIFDFRCPGVTSMSADTHKYGHATKGTSVIVFRSLDLQHSSYFPYSNWSGGLYITPTIAGSRPGALIGCAWAALISIGEDGYKQKAKFIVNGARRIAKEIQSIPGLKLITQNPTIVVAFTSDEFNIYRVKDALSKMGWSLNPLQSPRALNICVTENIAVEKFVRDLRAAVARVQAEGPTQKTKGTAKIYNAIKTLPSGPVEYAMCRFTDATLTP